MKRIIAVTALLTALPLIASADPCGMVPPIYLGQGIPITRVGPQRTYVFYKDGLETYVIRPGFQGKVDEFGMLIPFPSPPALRKVPDEIFTQLTAAIEPPEVVVDLRPMPPMALAAPGVASGAGREDKKAEQPLAYDEVKVLHQEAVGMYEVAVLAAGSAAALNKWMDQHGFKYPKGMDDVCNEYVKAGWVFVAEKTKVGSKPKSDPKPGMKKVDPSLPAGATFDGYVQAMGFRFKIDKPVVPMRLSPFNEGEKRQIVYYLTTDPVKIDGVPDKLVKRQVSGVTLVKNVVGLLPIRLFGGTAADLTPDRLQGLKPQRNPKPHNGGGKDLFASDLLSLKTGELSLPHEEKEKELLRIGEALNLRGPEIDTLHEAELETERDKDAEGALSGLKGMTMTVVDGDFPIDYMKDHDLTVSRWVMKADNDRDHYDPKTDGLPGPVSRGWYGYYDQNDKGLRIEGDPTEKKGWYQKIWESP